MNVRKQIKQKVMKLALKAEEALYRFRTDHENQEFSSPKEERKKDTDPGQIRTYYNNSKEERKLH